MSTSTVAPSGYSVTMRGRRLEDFEKEEIIARLKAGIPAKDVSGHFGISYWTIARLARTSGIDLTFNATIEKNKMAIKMASMRASGMGYRDIAEATKCRISTVYNYVHLARHKNLAIELPPPPIDRTYERSLAVVQEYARGITWAGQAPPAWCHRNIRVLSATMTTRELAIMLKCPQFEILKIVEGRKCANM